MPYEVHVYSDKRLVEVRTTGMVTDDDVIGIDNRMRSDPSITPDFNQLVDAGETSEADFSSAGVLEITSREPFFSTASRRAIVAPTDAGFGMSRMFELYRGNVAGEIQVFRTRTEALAWLGVSLE
ncbi:MAG: hypothetical protein JRJ39_02530 [Deltaproteobacteria bacterium]|nr:hypothetical protein [Deltaproteobacteria bacterium]